MALNAKNKLVFVNGTLSKPTSSVADIQLWERCSDMVLSWILNSIDKSIVSSLIYHACPRDVWLNLEDRFSQSNNPRIFKLKRDIATLTQGSMTISAYFTTLKSHWDELAMLTPTPQCTCGILTELNHMQDTERVFQFLMGLHDSYASIRSQVLAMDPLPPVNKVYSTLHQEEKQRLLHIPSFPTESAAMMAPHHPSHRFDSKGEGMVVQNTTIVTVMVTGEHTVISSMDIPATDLNLVEHLIEYLVRQRQQIMSLVLPLQLVAQRLKILYLVLQPLLRLLSLASQVINTIGSWNFYHMRTPTLLVILSPVTLLLFLTENGLLIQELPII